MQQFERERLQKSYALLYSQEQESFKKQSTVKYRGSAYPQTKQYYTYNHFELDAQFHPNYWFVLFITLQIFIYQLILHLSLGFQYNNWEAYSYWYGLAWVTILGRYFMYFFWNLGKPQMVGIMVIYLIVHWLIVEKSIKSYYLLFRIYYVLFSVVQSMSDKNISPPKEANRKLIKTVYDAYVHTLKKLISTSYISRRLQRHLKFFLVPYMLGYHFGYENTLQLFLIDYFIVQFSHKLMNSQKYLAKNGMQKTYKAAPLYLIGLANAQREYQIYALQFLSKNQKLSQLKQKYCIRLDEDYFPSFEDILKTYFKQTLEEDYQSLHQRIEKFQISEKKHVVGLLSHNLVNGYNAIQQFLKRRALREAIIRDAQFYFYLFQMERYFNEEQEDYFIKSLQQSLKEHNIVDRKLTDLIEYTKEKRA